MKTVYQQKCLRMTKTQSLKYRISLDSIIAWVKSKFASPYTQMQSSLLVHKKERNLKFNYVEYDTILGLVRDCGCDIAPCRVTTYNPLRKILKFIAQNLQHGSIF